MAENMKHMARDPMDMDSEEIGAAAPATSDEEEGGYPYGLCLRLENEELEKLGIKTLPPVGKTVHIIARGKIESAHESQSPHNMGDKSLGIQITHLMLSGEAKTT